MQKKTRVEKEMFALEAEILRACVVPLNLRHIQWKIHFSREPTLLLVRTVQFLVANGHLDRVHDDNYRPSCVNRFAYQTTERGRRLVSAFNAFLEARNGKMLATLKVADGSLVTLEAA